MDYYSYEIAGLRRNLPIFELTSRLRVAVLNMFGDTELLIHTSKLLVEQLFLESVDTFVTAEAKGIPLCYEIARQTSKNWVVLHKSSHFYTGDAISATTWTPITKSKKTLYLAERDKQFIYGSRVALVDDVITTGTTMNLMRKIVEMSQGIVVSSLVVCTEGDIQSWDDDVISLGHLPFFRSL